MTKPISTNQIKVFSSDIPNCPNTSQEALKNFNTKILLAIGECQQIYGNSSQQAKALLIKYQHILFTLGMLIREVWDSKHKPVGMPTQAYPTYKQLGQLYERLLTMAERIRTLDELAPLPLPEGTPLDWTLSVMALENEFEGITNGTKRECVEKIGHNSGSLKRLENPFDCTESPIIYTLVEIARCHAQANDTFRKKHWNPFHKAYSEWKKHYKSDAWRPAEINTNGTIKYLKKGGKRGLTSL